MKTIKYISGLFLCCIIAGNALGQSSVYTLTFTAVNNTQHHSFDSILIRNITRGVDTTLYYPDTTLDLGNLAIGGKANPPDGFRLFQNVPNPAAGETMIRVYVPQNEEISVGVTDTWGRTLIYNSYSLRQGMNRFTFTPGKSKQYYFTVYRKHSSGTITILNTGAGHALPFVKLEGNDNRSEFLKEAHNTDLFGFSAGDHLLLVCYSDTLESGIQAVPAANETYSFQFAWNIPCPGLSEVSYGGQIYHTVQIFSQCWFRENLNIGTRVQNDINSTDNGIIEKYCYDNIEDSCTTYGGFYQWNEMMAYTSGTKVQGICPSGWHIPSDDEWNILEGAVETGFNIGDTMWTVYEVAGLNAGYNLKSTMYWQNDGNGSGQFGFDVPPIGYRDYFGPIYGFGHASKHWSAGVYNDEDAWSRGLGCHGRDVVRLHESKNNGYSVRCLRD